MIHTAPSHGTKFDDSVLDTPRIGALVNVATGTAYMKLTELSSDDRKRVGAELARWVVFAELSKLAGGGIPFLDFDDIVDSVSQHVFLIDTQAAIEASADDDLLEIVAELAAEHFNIDTDGTYTA